MGKKKWVTITITEHFLVPEEFTDEQCSTHMIERLYKEGGWPGVTVKPGPAELYGPMRKRQEEYWKERCKTNYYDVDKGWFTYTTDQDKVILGKYTVNVAELLEQGFMLGDHVVIGTLKVKSVKGSKDNIMFIGKFAECELWDLMPNLEKLYEYGPIHEPDIIETLLMELYKTILIEYV